MTPQIVPGHVVDLAPTSVVGDGDMESLCDTVRQVCYLVLGGEAGWWAAGFQVGGGQAERNNNLHSNLTPTAGVCGIWDP